MSKKQSVSDQGVDHGIYAAYETDKAAETEGQWVTGLRQGMDVKVARFGNEKYRKSFQRRIKPFRQQFDRDAMDEGKLTEIMIAAIADGILIDWNGPGFVDRDGNALEYSRDAAVTLLTDLPDFREDIIALSREAETYRKQDQEESAGNSSAS